MVDFEMRLLERAAADGDEEAAAYLRQLRLRADAITDVERFERSLRAAFLETGPGWPTGRDWEKLAAWSLEAVTGPDQFRALGFIVRTRSTNEAQVFVVAEPDRVTVGITQDVAGWRFEAAPGPHQFVSGNAIVEWDPAYAFWASRADPERESPARDRAQTSRATFTTWAEAATGGRDPRVLRRVGLLKAQHIARARSLFPDRRR